MYKNYDEFKNREPNTTKKVFDNGKLVPIKDCATGVGNSIVVEGYIYDILKDRIKLLEDTIIKMSINNHSITD